MNWNTRAVTGKEILEDIMEAKKTLETMKGFTPDTLPLRIFTNKYLTVPEQYKFSRRKKKRITKKFAKKYIRQVPNRNVYIMGNMVFCHPAIESTIRRDYEKENRN